MRIDLPTFLIHLRYDLLQRGRSPLLWRLGFKGWKLGMRSKFLYRWGSKLGRWCMGLFGKDGWNRRLLGPGSGWTAHRDFHAMDARPFHKRWPAFKRELDAKERR